MLRSLLAFSVILFLSFYSIAAYGGIAVKPANVTLDLNKGRPSGQFVISNTGDTEERYRVRSTHFGYTLNGQLQLISPNHQSLATWVKFNPKEFTLPPNSKRVVRFVVLPRGKLTDGEFWGAMELESLNTDMITDTDQEGRKVSIKVVPSVLVPIFGRSGKINHKGMIDDIELKRIPDGSAISAQLTNTGLGRLFVRGHYSVINEDNVEVMSGSMPRGLVLSGLSRRFESLSERELPSGRYQLRIEYGAKPLGSRKLTYEKSIELP